MTYNSRTRILLLHPPVVKPSEPPAGIARLAGALQNYGIPCTVVDLNLEGLFSLMHGPLSAGDRWSQRALRGLSKNLSLIRSLDLYQSFDRYQRSVMDLNRVFEKSSSTSKVHLSLANYQHRELSPVRSNDLLRAAEVPEENPFFPFFQQRLLTLMAAENPTVAGISLNYLSQALCAFTLLGLLRREFPGLTLVLGGGLVTSWLRRPDWKNPFVGLVDHLVAGAGESSLLAIAGISGAGQRHFVSNFDFVSTPFRDAGIRERAEGETRRHGDTETRAGERGEAPELENLASGERKESGASGDSNSQHPAPSTHYSSLNTCHSSLLTHYSPYLAPGFILPYSASSGCYWNRCAFCPERAEGSPYVPIPVTHVIKELQDLAETTKPLLLHLLDNALSPQLLKALSQNPPGVPWYGFARITEHFAEGDFCTALKHSGCTMLQVGIESGDQQVLDNESKGIELETVSQALHNLRKAGIATYVYLLFGTPSETLHEARKTLAFTVQHAEEISFLNLALFNLPLYGPETRELKTRMHYDGDLSLYVDFDHPKGWHRARVRQFLDKEFKRHPAVAPIIRRDPPLFTSNHAPFFGRFE
jgi:radical SAM superfamily enzyme YgiQ (UPF0313 family)